VKHRIRKRTSQTQNPTSKQCNKQLNEQTNKQTSKQPNAKLHTQIQDRSHAFGSAALHECFDGAYSVIFLLHRVRSFLVYWMDSCFLVCFLLVSCASTAYVHAICIKPACTWLYLCVWSLSV
jgi:hypothetical protein